MRRPLALVIVWLMLVPPNVGASQATFRISQSALNNIASAVGTMSGDAGRYDIDVYVPCFPDFWDSCVVTLFSSDLDWKLSNPQFTITTTGISFKGDVTASYSSFTLTTSATGTVNASYSAPNLALKLGSISVPIRFNIPFFGNVTLTTLTLNPQYGFVVPIGPAQFQVNAPGGATHTVNAQLNSAAFTYHNGYLVIDTGLLLW